MNWLLLVVVAIFAGFTYLGYKKGLIMTAFSIGSILITLILASILTPIVGNVIRSNQTIYSAINKKMVELVNLDQINAQTDEAQIEAIDSLELPKALKSLLKENNNLEVYQDRAVSSFKDYIADYLTRIVINAIVYICVYIVIRIIVYFVARALDVLSKLPIVNQFNKAGGSFVGFIEGLLIVWLVFVLVTMMASTDIGKSALQCIGESSFLEFFYDNNLIMKVITGFIR